MPKSVEKTKSVKVTEATGSNNIGRVRTLSRNIKQAMVQITNSSRKSPNKIYHINDLKQKTNCTKRIDAPVSSFDGSGSPAKRPPRLLLSPDHNERVSVLSLPEVPSHDDVMNQSPNDRRRRRRRRRQHSAGEGLDRYDRYIKHLQQHCVTNRSAQFMATKVVDDISARLKTEYGYEHRGRSNNNNSSRPTSGKRPANAPESRPQSSLAPRYFSTPNDPSNRSRTRPPDYSAVTYFEELSSAAPGCSTVSPGVFDRSTVCAFPNDKSNTLSIHQTDSRLFISFDGIHGSNDTATDDGGNDPLEESDELVVVEPSSGKRRRFFESPEQTTKRVEETRLTSTKRKNDHGGGGGGGVTSKKGRKGKRKSRRYANCYC